jgi:broad specificity phosphatase PhoE
MWGLLAASLPFHGIPKAYCHRHERYRALRCESKERVKTIHFVRHAEGHHNVAGRNDPFTGYLREDLEDATLTDDGIEQCKKLHLATQNKVENAQLLVVSPLNRTMQTASYSFPHMKGKIPWIAIENLREQTGLHPCDRRKSISEHKTKYAHVDFSNIAHDKDPLYYNYRLREPNADVVVRAKHFMDWLMARPETEIIVVTHHGYLLNVFRDVIHTTDPDVDGDDFRNCELRTFIVKY